MRRAARLAAMLAAGLSLAACDGGLLPGGNSEGAIIDSQHIHPAGVVLQVLTVRSADDRALVNIRVFNSRDSEIQLNAQDGRSFLVTDSGEKLPLAAPATNAKLATPPGKSLDGALIFVGNLDGQERATLVFNETGSGDNRYTSSPRFEVALPLAGARGGDVPETSAMSNMASLPASRLRQAASGSASTFGPTQATGSTFGPAANATSRLEKVEKLKSELGAMESERGTVVSLSGDITFDFDKATIRDEAGATLDRLAELIAAGSEGEVVIEGHTDAKGDDAYNKRLSEQRAGAVKAYLVEKGVAADRLKTIGLGELRPIAPNAKQDGTDDEAGRQRNRRVEVILPRE